MELHISDVSDWTVFNAIAAVMEHELGGEWRVQADGLDQRYWDMALDGGVITLHLEHYLGIMLLVENKPANPRLDAQLMAKARGVLEPFLNVEPPPQPPSVPAYKVLRPKLGFLRLVVPVLLRQAPLALIAMWLLSSSSPEEDSSKAWAGSLFGALVLLLMAYRLAKGIYQRTSLIVDPAGKAVVAGVTRAFHTPRRVVIRCDFARVLIYRTLIVYENGSLLVARHHDGKQDRQQACDVAAYLGVSAYHESRSKGLQKVKAPA